MKCLPQLNVIDMILFYLKSRKWLIGLFGLIFLFALIRICQVPYNGNQVILISSVFLLIFFLSGNKYSLYVSGSLTAIALLVIWYNFSIEYHRIFEIREWDLLAFYLFAKIGVSGYDFYDPASMVAAYSSLDMPITLSTEFIEEISFQYPPVTMLIFAPFGFFGLPEGIIAWKIFVWIFLILDAVLIINMLKIGKDHITSSIALIVLFLLFPGTIMSQQFGQTTFLLLFFLILTFKNLTKTRAGFFLGIAVIIKPIAAIWCLFLILNRRWRTLAIMILTAGFFTVIAGLIFGFDNYISYITNPPSAGLPQRVYSEGINQSLQAILLRLNSNLGLSYSFGTVTLFSTILSIILVLTCAMISYKVGRSNQRISFILIIPLSLVIYPGTLAYYSVFLIPVFVEIFETMPREIDYSIVFVLLVLFMSMQLPLFVVSIVLLIVLFSMIYKMNSKATRVVNEL